ncbi:MAG: sigma-70 family RNA polymerase sigma factor [Sedimentisphaerales bacterium]|nr:sigma-70 family RNA polymerase sigma factor [Sedimentisphaerales bacterium]
MDSDWQLIEWINGGDADAFESLYFRYRNWVYNLAWRFTRNHTDSLDVLQETFAYLLGKFPGFTLSASMTTFLYPVVKHLALNISMKNRRFASGEDKLDEIPVPPSEESARGRSELAAVLAILPEQQREILLMRFVDDMNLKEIAAALNIPEGTVKSRLHRALGTLRQDERTRNYFLE